MRAEPLSPPLSLCTHSPLHLEVPLLSPHLSQGFPGSLVWPGWARQRGEGKGRREWKHLGGFLQGCR